MDVRIESPASETVFVPPPAIGPPQIVSPADLSPIEFYVPPAFRELIAVAEAGALFAVAAFTPVIPTLGALAAVSPIPPPWNFIAATVALQEAWQAARTEALNRLKPRQPASPVPYDTGHLVPYRGSGAPVPALIAVEALPPLLRYQLAALGFAIRRTRVGVIPDIGPALGMAGPLPATFPALERCADTLVTGVTARSGWRAWREVTPMSAIVAAPRPTVTGIAAADGDFAAVDARLANIETYLRAAPAERRRLRDSLFWIAVNPEDPPDRPVNIPVTSYPQYDAELWLGSVHVRARYSIAGLQDGGGSERCVVLLHGHSSRLEETEDLRTALLALGHTVAAVDLPGCGYSSRHELAEAASWGGCLAFYDAFVLGFMAYLLTRHGFAGISCLSGGSLGGNLGLRLARGGMLPAAVGHVAVWSPASVWPAPDFGKQLGITMARGRVDQPESLEARREFFHLTYFEDWLGTRQANQWYRASWPPKAIALDSSWVERQEHYGSKFRRWHWQVAAEQLADSHQAYVNGGGVFTAQLTIMAGSQDNFENVKIYDGVGWLAERVPRGVALLWQGVGHSIHNEFPAALAGRIDAAIRGAL